MTCYSIAAETNSFTAMSSRLATRIVQLNNGALAHFLEGDYNQAVFSLRQAFEIFETQCSTHILGIDMSSPLYTSASGAPLGVVGTSLPQPPSLVDTIKCMMGQNNGHNNDKRISPKQRQNNTVVDSADGTTYSLYNRAFVLAEGQDDYTVLVQHRNRTGAILLYNLALVHHNIGIHRGVSMALSHALRLYDMSLETIDHSASLLEFQKLILALLNNMGSIHAHFHNWEQTQMCLFNLKTVLTATSPTLTLDEDYVFFFLNAMFQCKELCFAPAA